MWILYIYTILKNSCIKTFQSLSEICVTYEIIPNMMFLYWLQNKSIHLYHSALDEKCYICLHSRPIHLYHSPLGVKLSYSIQYWILLFYLDITYNNLILIYNVVQTNIYEFFNIASMINPCLFNSPLEEKIFLLSPE